MTLPGTSQAQWEANLDFDDYFAFNAINLAINNSDIRPQENINYYHNSATDKWHTLPWDIDLTWEDGPHGGSTNEYIYHCLQPRPQGSSASLSGWWCGAGRDAVVGDVDVVVTSRSPRAWPGAFVQPRPMATWTSPLQASGRKTEQSSNVSLPRASYLKELSPDRSVLGIAAKT